MSIAASNVAPNFSIRRQITAADLQRLQEPAVIYEHAFTDSDGELTFAYTVAGWLDGVNIATEQGGCTVGGDVILIHARNREEADMLASMGLGDTINSLDTEDKQIDESKRALTRMRAVGAVERINQATRPDKNEQFIADADAITRLRGDDVILSAGKVH